ncbi:MAG TPA: adenylate/guanylate cyclase domain-containing protein [Methylomirabilota bacterium]|nr:adenylate/guanylate cyclase domain-containing protein [Methylomirabilota bacterium]
MREGTRRRLRLFFGVAAAGTVVGIGYGGLIGFAGWGAPALGGLIGAVHGLTIAACIGLLEIFAVRTPLGQRVERAPLPVTMLVKGLVYGSVVAAVELGDLGERLIRGRPADAPQSAFLPLSVVFSFLFTFTFIFVLHVSRIVGGRTLRDIVLGRYHRPRLESRFFLFVDVVGSTRIAERVGPFAVHRFLNRVFSLAADPVADHHGEIHQYVGDEIVVTWPLAQGRIRARPVACFFAIETALSAAAEVFERDVGDAPAVRGAVHAGPVVTGEVGESKREIVFHGDVMNSTARLEDAARELGHPLLVSGDARALLDGAEGYEFRELGRRALRGRAGPVDVFAVTRRTPARD